MTASVKKPLPKRAASLPDKRLWTTAKDCPDASACERQVEALGLWLQWNTVYEQVTERLYQHGPDHRQLEDLMDRMDQMRRKAVHLSRELVH